MKTNTVIERLASLIVQNQNCVEAGNKEWEQKTREELNHIEKSVLPSGSGIDAGCTIDRQVSTDKCVVIVTSYHHMNENGMYDGWTQHVVKIRASFLHGMDISFSGPNRNQIKEYLHDVFYTALEAQYEAQAETV